MYMYIENKDISLNTYKFILYVLKFFPICGSSMGMIHTIHHDLHILNERWVKKKNHVFEDCLSIHQ